MAVLRGEDSENPDMGQFWRKNRRFWRAAPQVNEDFLRAQQGAVFTKAAQREEMMI